MRPGSVRILLAFVTASAFAHSVVRAQAWLPPKGDGSVNIAYTQSAIGDHLFSSKIYEVGGGPRSQDLGDIDSRISTVGFSYGVLNRFAVSGDLSYVTSRYTGTTPDNPEIDNGSWNNSMQDFRTYFRYQAYRSRALVVTPLAGFAVPVTNYETFGHAAVGSHKWEIPVGVSLGAPFGRYRPLAYIIATGVYSFVERIEGIGTNRTNAVLEVGGLPHPNVTLRLLGGWQNTHGGIDWATMSDEMFDNHDAVADADYWSGAAGISWTINSTFDLYATYYEILAGSNTHQLRSVAIGTSWNFGSGNVGRRKIGGREGPPSAHGPKGDGSAGPVAVQMSLPGW